MSTEQGETVMANNVAFSNVTIENWCGKQVDTLDVAGYKIPKDGKAHPVKQAFFSAIFITGAAPGSYKASLSASFTGLVRFNGPDAGGNIRLEGGTPGIVVNFSMALDADDQGPDTAAAL